MLAPWKKSGGKPRQCIKKQRHHFANKGWYSQTWGTGRPGVLQFMGSQRVRHDWATDLIWSDGFSSSHVCMWELDHKEGWAPENWCFQTVVLEKTLGSPLDSKEIKPVNPKGNQPWIFIGRLACWSWSSNTLATWCKEMTHWRRPWCWERLRAGGEGDSRGWEGWMASPTQCTWVWANSAR